jgi:hypothetical protein
MKIDDQQIKILLIDNGLENWNCLLRIFDAINYNLQKLSPDETEVNLATDLM